MSERRHPMPGIARRLFLPAATLLLMCPALFGQERDLQLATSIKTQRYCAVSANIDALQLALRLRYTNTGNRKLILYKGNRLFYQILVSRSAEDLEARRYETRTTHSRFYDQQPEKIDGAHPGEVFTVLSPGASYETQQVIILPISRDEAKDARDTLASGNHVLQIAASTWYESRNLAQTLRERWQRRGFLWTDTLAAPIINFNVEKNRSAVVCQ